MLKEIILTRDLIVEVSNILRKIGYYGKMF